jgi:hypothetical protein
MQARSRNEVQITDEERAVLRSAARDGYVCARLFKHGDFDEEGFLFFGKLEAMCRKGLLRFVDRRGEAERSPGDLRLIFAPAEGATARLGLCAA